MIDLPDASVFAAIVREPRFIIAAGVAVLAGIVRGFSGFGAALIYVPLLSAFYGPKVASATLLMINFVTGVPFAIRAAPRCDFGEVLPILVAAAIGVPLGTMMLLAIEPTILRWFICAAVLVLLVVLVSGWRYHGKPKLPVTLGVGFVSGVGGGAAQIAGPPVILYWLGGAAPAATARANMFVYFALTGMIMFVFYIAKGLITADVIALALALGAPCILAMWIGAKFFYLASDIVYRRVAYLIVAGAAIVGLPLFDGLLR